MRNEKIANHQLWFILFIMRSTVILSFLPVLTSADALQDAWMSALLTLVGSEVFVLLISLLTTKFPDMTIIEYSQYLLGRWPGKLFGVIFLWLFLERSVVNIRIYGELLATGFLPNTPLFFLIGAMVFASTICVHQGIEVLGRVTDVLFFIFLSMIIGVILISSTEFDIHNLEPALARGWKPIFSGALTPTALISQVWVLGMLTPYTLEPKKVVKTALTSIGLSISILVIVVIITIGVMSPQEGARAVFPLLSLMRSIEFTEFLERMEVLVIFSWGLGLFTTVSVYLYSGAKGVSQLFNLKDYREILWPMAVIWVFLSVQGFDDIFSLYDFLKPANFVPYGFFFLIVPLTVLWSSYGLRFFQRKIKEG